MNELKEECVAEGSATHLDGLVTKLQDEASDLKFKLWVWRGMAFAYWLLYVVSVYR